MSWSLYLSGYLLVGFGVIWLLALKDRAEIRPAFFLAICWPVLFVLVPCVLIEDRTPYRVDMVVRRDLSMFGVRRPEKTWGLALRVFWLEFQVWKVRTPV